MTNEQAIELLTILALGTVEILPPEYQIALGMAIKASKERKC